MSTTFNCPFCGAPITGPAPGATFACPYCRAKVMAPHEGVAMGPSSARAWSGGQSENDPARTFTGGIENVAVTVDPQLGFVAVGVHAPHGKPAVLRCWDAKNAKPVWDALQGQSWLERVTREQLSIRGRNVYVSNKRQLVCLDLVRGTQKWTTSLSDAPAGSWEGTLVPGIRIGDPFPAGQRGAILVATIDHTLFAFDRDSGQLLWQRSMGDGEVSIEAVPDLGACVVRYGGSYVKADIVNPAYLQPIASLGHDHWSTDLGACRITGRTVLTVVDDMGPEGDEDGLLCFDAVTGQRHFFDQVEDLETNDVVPVTMGARAFAAMSSGEGLYVGPRGRPMPVPVPNHAIAAMLPAGPTLALLLKKSHGSSVRRVVGIDPNTLGFRWDAGEAGTEPDDHFDRHMVTDGYSLAYVASPDDDADQCEIRSVDTTTGRRLWSRPCGEWFAHRFVGGTLVVWSREKIEALAPQNGQVLGTIS